MSNSLSLLEFPSPAISGECTVDDRRILLVLPPLWPPLIPPMGLAMLKSHLRASGFINVRCVDLNCIDSLRMAEKRYIEQLARWIPKTSRGILGKLASEVLQNHLLVWRNSGGSVGMSVPVLREIISLSFYRVPPDELISQLNEIVGRFFHTLEDCLSELYARETPEVLGVSVPGLPTLAAAQAAIGLYKERCPNGVAVLGGSIFLTGLAETPDFDDFRVQVAADYFVVGDGAADFVNILRGGARQAKVRFAKPPGFTPGIGSRTTDPDYSDFNLNRYPYIGTEQTISCPFQCGFCNLPRYLGPFRKRPAALIAEEMSRLYRRYGSQLIFMADSLLNPIVTDLAEELLELEVPLYIDGYLRVQDSLCDRETAEKLRLGGLYRARIGVESGSQRVLDSMDKRASVEQASGTVRALASAGIKTTVFIVVGYPGETEADFRATLEWIREMQNDIWQLDCSPFTYWYSGQCRDDEWAPLRRPLYSPMAKRLLPLQSWELDCEPSRERVYRRFNDVVELCTQLHIPDPHEIREHYEADARWGRLHENAVPRLVDFARHKRINECRRTKWLAMASAGGENSDAFRF